MARLTTKERKKLSKREFAAPGRRSRSGGKGGFPIPDKKHARNAKARASMLEHEGKMSKSEEEKIDAKADRKLGKRGKRGHERRSRRGRR